ncbi:MAG: TIGR02452 family protein [Saprospiraceae bacterium]|nr:TIGR02452 family protein [Saprospiraceae bacterium]
MARFKFTWVCPDGSKGLFKKRYEMRKTNKEIANMTLDILNNGFYIHNTTRFEFQEEINRSLENTITVTPSDWDEILSKENNRTFTTEIIFKNSTTIEAILSEKDEQKIAALNFSSAKNPGGGFINGASAQEESLARSSSLYSSLVKDTLMYDYNKKRSTFLYSDYMIYSSDVIFWFDDHGQFVNPPIKVDIITAPAPNKGAMIQHNRTEELQLLDSIFKERINKVLSLAAYQGVEYIILGAWGCGVFRNDISSVAKMFKQVIDEKYSNTFKKIIFSIYDSSTKRKL